ncbi:MAG: DUF2490 domain-containing protein [Opitutaceae bacterium]
MSFVAACVARAADEFGSWHTLSLGVLENERWKLTALGQVRFRDHSSQLFAYVLSPQVEFKASPYLRVGLNYTYLPAKPPGRSRFLDQKRWEFELNPRWPVSEQLTLDLRNRYELRWIEGRAGINERSRHRPQATFRLRHAGPLESVFAHHEIFYDYVLHRRTETRLVPAGFNFRLSPRAGFLSYYLIRSVLAAREWTHSQVIGTQFSIKL